MMNFYKLLGSALCAGSTGLLLLGSAEAQPKVPSEDEVTQSVPNVPQVDANTQTDAKAKTPIDGPINPQANIDANVETDATVQPDAKAQIEAKPEAGPSPSVDVQTEGKLGANAKARVENSAKVQRPTKVDVGFQFQANQEDSLLLSSVQANSLAARAGLQAGDQIVSIDGRDLRTQTKLNAYLSALERGQVVVLFDRAGRRYQTSFMYPGQATVRGPVQLQKGELKGTTLALGDRGIIVDNISEGSSFRQAGLQAGDEIVCFNGWAYRDVNQFVSSMDRMPHNRPISVNAIRDGRLISTQVTLRDSDATYAESTDQVDAPVPPAPQTFESDENLSDGTIVRSNLKESRTALKPNDEEFSHRQLQHKIDQLQEENRALRSELEQYRGTSHLNSGTPNAKSEAEAEASSHGILTPGKDAEESTETKKSEKQ